MLKLDLEKADEPDIKKKKKKDQWFPGEGVS